MHGKICLAVNQKHQSVEKPFLVLVGYHHATHTTFGLITATPFLLALPAPIDTIAVIETEITSMLTGIQTKFTVACSTKIPEDAQSPTWFLGPPRPKMPTSTAQHRAVAEPAAAPHKFVVFESKVTI